MITPVPLTEAAFDPRVGTVVEKRYRLSALLGRGGMCAVYRAEDQESGRQVAVKILPAGMAERPDLAARFQREVASGRRIQHPNVVAVFDSGTLADGALFLVMELVEGRSLADALDQGRLAIPRAIAIARQILAGLEATHALGITHRDIKPENVMLVGRGASEQVKLVDFGIASNDRAAVKLTSAGTVFGTPEYISPEMAMGLAVDTRADLYSLGIVLYEMVTGERPFEGEAKALLQAHVTGKPRPPREVAPDASIPAALEAAILRALEKLPEDRFASAQAMSEALSAIGPERGKRRTLLTITIVLLCVAAAAALLLFSTEREPETPAPARHHSLLRRRHLRGPRHRGPNPTSPAR